MEELKRKIEQGKFKIKLINFKPKVKTFLGSSRVYILKYDNKIIFLGLSYGINNLFREILKDVYGDLYLIDYPNSFFKRYIVKEYTKGKRQTKRTTKSKKSYYNKLRIENRKRKIKRLQEEIKDLKKLNFT